MVKMWAIVLVVLSALVVLLLGWELLYSEEPYASSVAVKQIYRDYFSGKVTKVVYDATGSENLSAYRADCAQNDGVFEECGNICAPGASACVEVCAVTCML